MSAEQASVAEVTLRGEADLRSLLVAMIDQSDLSRAEIARFSGLPESRLSRSYNGKTVTTIETLLVVASVLGHRVAIRIE